MASRETSALYLLALAHLQNAHPEKAATLLAALDALESGQPATLMALAWSQVRSNQPAQALSTLGRIRSGGGVSASYYLVRAQALEALQRQPEAYLAIRTFLRLRGPVARNNPPQT
ncbi:MAG: hypothetical protein RI884_2235 [Pseudomonadota bacterium]|jgi:predicted Zn-dependent protease